MAETETSDSDMAVGLGAAFVLLAGAAALVTYTSPSQLMVGWGFAAMLTAGTLAIAALHLYW